MTLVKEPQEPHIAGTLEKREDNYCFDCPTSPSFSKKVVTVCCLRGPRWTFGPTPYTSLVLTRELVSVAAKIFAKIYVYHKHSSELWNLTQGLYTKRRLKGKHFHTTSYTLVVWCGQWERGTHFTCQWTSNVRKSLGFGYWDKNKTILKLPRRWVVRL